MVDEKVKNFVLIDELVEDINFSRTHMDLLIRRGIVNTAIIDGSEYMTIDELERFKLMRESEKDSLMKMFSEQDDIKNKAAAEIAALFDKE